MLHAVGPLLTTLREPQTMKDEVRIASWVLVGLFVIIFALLAPAAIRARRRGEDLGAGFVPSVLIWGAMVAVMLSMALGHSPDWLRYSLMAIAGGMLVVVGWRLWLLVKLRRRDHRHSSGV